MMVSCIHHDPDETFIISPRGSGCFFVWFLNLALFCSSFPSVFTSHSLSSNCCHHNIPPLPQASLFGGSAVVTVTSSVNFVPVSAPSEPGFQAPPTIDAKLPSEFFFPFTWEKMFSPKVYQLESCYIYMCLLCQSFQLSYVYLLIVKIKDRNVYNKSKWTVPNTRIKILCRFVSEGYRGDCSLVPGEKKRKVVLSILD